MAEPQPVRVQPSDEALHHLALLLAHRPNKGDLHVVLKPERCEACRELFEWAVDYKVALDG